MGCVPMQVFVALAKLKGLGVCPSRILLVWQTWRHWVCSFAAFYRFCRTKGIGPVPMQNVFGLADLKSHSVCPCKILLVWHN